MDIRSDEKELRRSVRLLGSVLARVLKTQAGSEVAATVEQLQRGFTRLRRDGGIARREHLFDAIEPLAPEVISAVVRAFNLYFSLVNISEESYYLRLRRRQAERGGSPNVTPETTALALRLQAQTILQEYVRRLDGLRGQLSHSYFLCQPTAAFLDSLEADREALDEPITGLEKPFLQEPYRHKLGLMKYRMERTLTLVEQRLKGGAGQTDSHVYERIGANR